MFQLLFLQLDSIPVKMLKVFVFVGIIMVCNCDKNVTIRDSECWKTYNQADGEFTLLYHGDTLKNCTIFIKTQGGTKEVCAYIEKMELSSCATTIEFYSYKYNKRKEKDERKQHKMFSCTLETVEKFCAFNTTKVRVDFIHPGVNTSDEVQIRIKYEDNYLIYYILIPFGVIAGLAVIGVSVYEVYRWRKEGTCWGT